MTNPILIADGKCWRWVRYDRPKKGDYAIGNSGSLFQTTEAWTKDDPRIDIYEPIESPTGELERDGDWTMRTNAGMGFVWADANQLIDAALELAAQYPFADAAGRIRQALEPCTKPRKVERFAWFELGVACRARIVDTTTSGDELWFHDVPSVRAAEKLTAKLNALSETSA